MQQIFAANCSIQEYVAKGKEFSFPKLTVCPGCKRSKPHKHGFYTRFCLDGYVIYRILIRRYYCQKCKATISFLYPAYQRRVEHGFVKVDSCL